MLCRVVLCFWFCRAAATAAAAAFSAFTLLLLVLLLLLLLLLPAAAAAAAAAAVSLVIRCYTYALTCNHAYLAAVWLVGIHAYLAVVRLKDISPYFTFYSYTHLYQTTLPYCSHVSTTCIPRVDFV